MTSRCPEIRRWKNSEGNSLCRTVKRKNTGRPLTSKTFVNKISYNLISIRTHEKTQPNAVFDASSPSPVCRWYIIPLHVNTLKLREQGENRNSRGILPWHQHRWERLVHATSTIVIASPTLDCAQWRTSLAFKFRIYSCRTSFRECWIADILLVEYSVAFLLQVFFLQAKSSVSYSLSFFTTFCEGLSLCVV